VILFSKVFLKPSSSHNILHAWMTSGVKIESFAGLHAEMVSQLQKMEKLSPLEEFEIVWNPYCFDRMTLAVDKQLVLTTFIMLIQFNL
jgi:hypothetical protein